MPSCVAWGCASRSDGGELFRVFPRKDLHRRKIWVDRLDRPGWNPTKFSVLCERHFDRDQWEVPRQDGKRKLKSTAVPTVFCVAYPDPDDVVAADHSYCIVGYKKLYDSKSPDAVEEKLHEESVIPIEHIKVEVDENQNFTPEDNEETETESEPENERNNKWLSRKGKKTDLPFKTEWKGMDTMEEEEAESIQCTPDIFLYSQQPDVDPIETVDWQDDGSENILSEPVSDPLAITPEDMVNVGGIVPHFGHTKKFLFVTKDTKYVLQTDTPVVEGDLRVPPRLRVLSPQRLSTLEPSNALSTTPIKPPSLATCPSPKQLTLTVKDSVKITAPLKLKVIRPNGDHSKINMVTKTLGGNGFLKPTKDRPAVKIIPTIKVDAKPSEAVSTGIRSQKVEIRVSPKNRNKIVTLTYPKVNQSPMIMKKRKLIIIKNSERLHINRYSPNFQRFSLGQGSISKMKKPTSPVEKVMLDHQYTNKQSWRPVSEDKEKVPIVAGEKVLKLLGNNEVKLWLNRRDKPPVIVENNKVKVDMHTQKINTDTDSINREIMIKSAKLMSEYKNILPKLNKKTRISIYQCSMCKSLYSSLETLKNHMSKVHGANTGLKATDTIKSETGKQVEAKDFSGKGEVKIDKLEGIKTKTVPCSFENGIVCIPNVNALNPVLNTLKTTQKPQQQQKTTLKSDKFVKLSSLRSNLNESEQNETIGKINSLDKKRKSADEIENEIGSKSVIKSKTTTSTGTCNKLNKKEPSCVYSLRTKSKLLKLKPTLIWRNKPSKSTKQSAIVKKNPIVLVAKVDLKDIQNMGRTRSKQSSTLAKDKVLTDKNQKIKYEEDQPSKEQKNGENTTVMCTECQTLVEKRILKSHLMKHASSGFSCSECFKKFPKSYQLRRHIKNDHNAFKCPLRSCAKSFESKRLLEKHTRSHKKKV